MQITRLTKETKALKSRHMSEKDVGEAQALAQHVVAAEAYV